MVTRDAYRKWKQHPGPMTRSQKALTIVGALITGWFVTASWEYIAKPGLEFLARVTVRAVSVGSDAFRDSVFEKAARESDDVLSVITVAVIASLVIGLWVSIRSYRRVLREPESHSEYIKTLLQRLPDNEFRRAAEAREREEAKFVAKEERFMRYVHAINLFYAVVAAVIALSQMARIGLSREVRQDFRHTMRICRPYIAESDVLLLESRFAQMKTRKEYRAIMGELYAVGKAHNLKLPDAPGQ